MLITIYLAAMFVFAILRHQERQHNQELLLEYELLNKLMPLQKPKIPLLESLLTIVFGIYLVLGFGYMLLRIYKVMVKFHQEEVLEFTAVIVITGITMVILGIQSLQRNRQFAKRDSAQKIDKTNS
jgi:hypothetical protein